jgi:TatD DNase family protein
MTDAHCHPWDLLDFDKLAEEKRRKTGTAAAASAWNREQFEYHEYLARKAKEDGAPSLFRCFALHPQLSGEKNFSPSEGIELLNSLAAEERLDAVGETGFDLFDDKFKAAESIQDKMFNDHLEVASHYGLPMILHLRKAMHKIFPFVKKLKNIPAVVFHSWPGTRGEAEALLKKGVNVYFSFGTTVLKNHKEAIASAAILPAERILLETDAPYQPLRGKNFSSWQDLSQICSCIADLRKNSGSPCATPEELEAQTTKNFYRIFTTNHHKPSPTTTRYL